MISRMPKSLFVILFFNHFALETTDEVNDQHDDDSDQLMEPQEAAFELFVTDEYLAKSIEPFITCTAS